MINNDALIVICVVLLTDYMAKGGLAAVGRLGLATRKL